MNIHSFLTRVVAITGIAVGAFAFVAVAQTWTAPKGSPPDQNVPAPINVGPNNDSSGKPITQVKVDGLVIQGLLGLSSLQFNPGGLSAIIPGSTLVASDNKGDATWSVPTSPNCSTSGLRIRRSNGTLLVNTVVINGVTFYAFPLALLGNGSLADNGTSGTNDSLKIFCVTAGPNPTGFGTNTVVPGSLNVQSGSVAVCLNHEDCPWGAWGNNSI